MVVSAQPRSWETELTIQHRDVAVIGITECLSLVNAGIIYFCNSHRLKQSGPTVNAKEALMKLMGRRE